MIPMASAPEIGTLSVREDNLTAALGEIVETAMVICGADFGNVQLVNPNSSDLTIVAQRGFPPWWLDFWSTVSRGQGTCGTALERGERVIIEDIEQSPIFAGTAALDIQRKAGVRAVQSTPIVSRSGKPLGMFSTHFKTPHRPDERTLRVLDLLARQARDIIQRAQAEAALRESEEQFRRAIADAPIPVIMHAEDGQVLQISHSWTELTGYGLKDMPTFEGWLNRAYGEGAESVRSYVRELFAGTRRTINVEFPIRVRDGRTRHWSFSASAPGILIDGRRFIVGMAVDISERKWAEDALREKQSRLELALEAAQNAARAKDKFLALLSHELRTPLMPALLTASILQQDKTLPAPVRADLDTIRRNIEIESRMINDLLDLSRITNDKLTLQRAGGD